MLTQREKDLGYIIYRLLEGDDVVDRAYDLLQRYKLVDEDNEWIYEDEDE